MSIGWGFLGGAGQALYDVQDQKIKDGMMHRRDLRNREWQMELEQYRTGVRRDETAEERSYMEKQGEIEAGRATKLQELKGKQSLELQRAKGGTTKDGTGKKRFEVIKQENPDGSVSLIRHDFTTGEMTPYGGAAAGEGGITYEQAKQMAEDEAVNKAGWLSSDESDFPGGRAAWVNRRIQEIMGSGAATAGATTAPADIGSAPSAKPELSADRAKQAAALRKKFEKDPTGYPAYLEKQGFSADEVAERASKRGLVKKEGKWTLEKYDPKGHMQRTSRTWNKRTAQEWADNLTEEAAKEQWATGPEMNRFLMDKGFFKHLTGKQKKRVYYIMRKLPKPE